MSNLQELTTEIVDLVAAAGTGQRDAVLKIGRKVEEYVLMYSAKVTEPALLSKARTKAVRVLAEDVAKQAPDDSFDLHRAYQILGVTKVYGDVSKTWSFSVLKEIAPTVRFDGEWKAKEGLDVDKLRATVATLGHAPTVVTARQEVTKLLGDMRRKPVQRKADQPAGSPAPAVLPPAPATEAPKGPAPMPRVVKGPGTKLQEAVRDVAKDKAIPGIDPLSLPGDPPPKLAGDESAPVISQKEELNAAVQAEKNAHEALEILRGSPDSKRSFTWIGKNLENDEIIAVVQGLSQFDGSWAALRAACKAEHERKVKK
jgi:hypothetical protein